MLHLGLQLNANIYRTFCCSLFSFLWQLEEPPEEVLNLEAWALRRLVPGPGNWIRPADLCQLKTKFGLPIEFPSFRHMALATKMRVCEYEPQLNLQSQCRELAVVRAENLVDRKAWSSWYQNSYALVLCRARSHFEQLDITQATVMRRMAQTYVIPRNPAELERFKKKHFQAQLLRQLLEREAYNHENIVRDHLERWHIASVPAGTLARRACRHLKHALDLVPLKVALVLFRTWFNGWCTARRFQVREAKCLLGCGAPCTFTESCFDSIDHYAYCPVVANFAQRHLQLPNCHVRSMVNFLCLSVVDDETLTLQLLLLHSVYSATNCIRYSVAPRALDCMDELLLQYIHQAASGSRLAQKVVHKRVTMRYAQRRRILV